MANFDNISYFPPDSLEDSLMPRFAANLTMLFSEHQFLERFALAKTGGFAAVEFLFPYAFAPADIKAALDNNSLKLVLHNFPPGDWDAGERGLRVIQIALANFDRVLPKPSSMRLSWGCLNLIAL